MIRKEIVLQATRDEVWAALTDPLELESWFANDVELDLRPGGEATFRWGNGESRHATVTEVEPGERLAFEWDDEGEVEFTLDDDADGTRLTIVETSPAWTTALDLQASALRLCLTRSVRCSRPLPTRAAASARLPRRPRHRHTDRADRRAADDAAGRLEAPRRAQRRGARRVRAQRTRDALPADGGRRGVGRPARRASTPPGAAAARLGADGALRPRSRPAARDRRRGLRGRERRDLARVHAEDDHDRDRAAAGARGTRRGRDLRPGRARPGPVPAPDARRARGRSTRSRSTSTSSTSSPSASRGRRPTATTGAGRSSRRRSTWRSSRPAYRSVTLSDARRGR